MGFEPEKIGCIHFTGIGGIGLSGLADILHSLGFHVQGSDLQENQNTQRLNRKGIKTFSCHAADNLAGVKVVVTSSAISPDNVEVLTARAHHIPVLSRADMLKEILKLTPAITISGTHGKTTTTSIGATVMRHAGLDPTIISGGVINDLGTNAVLGRGGWTIVEADESDGTFAQLSSRIAVVTNIDPEHLEHYGGFAQLLAAFRTYVEHVPFYGLAVMCADHTATMELAGTIHDRRVLTYGLSEHAHIRAIPVSHDANSQTFRIVLASHALTVLPPHGVIQADLGPFTIPMPGTHNLQNATAIIAVCLELGLSLAHIRQGLQAFKGVSRRLTAVGRYNDVMIIDDYAHHPCEISATLQALRQISTGAVVAVLQPHRYSRLSTLFDDYVAALRAFDAVALMPVYAAGEERISGFSSEKLAEALAAVGQKTMLVETLEDVRHFIKLHTQPDDYTVFMGAGDVTNMAKACPEEPIPRVAGAEGKYPETAHHPESLSA